MKRIIGLLTVTAACALASTASAYLDPTSVDGDGRAVDQVLTFGARLGSPANNVNIQAIGYTSDPDDQAGATSTSREPTRTGRIPTTRASSACTSTPPAPTPRSWRRSTPAPASRRPSPACSFT